MSDVPIQVIVAAFNDEEGASRALEALKELKKSRVVGIRDAAVMRCDRDGKLHLKETADWGAGRGAVVGGLVGAAAGLLAGPVGWLALGGAVVGGLASRWHDAGIPDERLRQIGQQLKPGTSAIIAIVEHRWVREVEEELRKQAADIATEAVSASVAAQLDAEASVSAKEGTPAETRS